MVSKELSEAAVEINVIFDNMSKDLLDKIPTKFKNFINEIQSRDYKFEYDSKRKLNEQKLLPKTKGLIALIYRDYLCNDIEKENYIKECKKILLLEEQKKQERYNPDNLFHSRNNDIEQSTMFPIQYKKVSLFQKIINKIKNIFL